MEEGNKRIIIKSFVIIKSPESMSSQEQGFGTGIQTAFTFDYWTIHVSSESLFKHAGYYKSQKHKIMINNR